MRRREETSSYSTKLGLWRCKYGSSHLTHFPTDITNCIYFASQVAHDKIPAKSKLIFDTEVLKIEDGPNPINVFKEIDEDGDDKLSRHEVGEFLKKQLAQAYQPGSQNDMEDHGSMLEEVFKHEDKDNDGFITREEFSGPKYDHEEL